MRPDRATSKGKIVSSEVEKSRREFLEDAVSQDPNNTFARYGLAMALAKTEPAAAWTHFEHLLTHHPEYAATYYQAGMFLVTRGRAEEARKVLSAGIEVTGRQGNKHAQSELQSALNDLSNNS